MNVQKDIDKIRRAMRLLWEAGLDTKQNLSAQMLVELESDCPPFVHVDIGHWSFMFDSERGFTCEYTPPLTDGYSIEDDWIDNVNEKMITDFLKPPKDEVYAVQEKCPDTSQSDQGKSIDEIARHHLTISEEENQ